MILVRVNVRGHNVVMKAETVIAGFKLLPILNLNKVVFVGNDLLELVLVVDVRARLFGAALEVARLDTEHERDANHNDEHEHVH